MTRLDRKIIYESKPRAGGHAFSLDRPAFNAGTYDCQDNNTGKCPPLHFQKRSGDACDVLRPAFLEDSIKPRTVNFDGDELKPQRESVLVGNYVTVRDLTDELWIAENERLRRILRAQFNVGGRTQDTIEALVDKELAINKPLGRDQRMIRKLSEDITTEKDMKLADKFRTVIGHITAGRADNRKTKADTTAELIKILADIGSISGDVKTLEGVIIKNQQEVVNAFKNINLPQSTQSMGINIDICGKNYFNANKGLILLHLINNAIQNPKGTYNVESPVKNESDDGIKIGSLMTMINMVNSNQAWPVGKRFLHIPDCTLIEYKTLSSLLYNSKINGLGLRYNIGFKDEVFSATDPTLEEFYIVSNIDTPNNIDATTNDDNPKHTTKVAQGPQGPQGSQSSQAPKGPSPPKAQVTLLTPPQLIIPQKVQPPQGQPPQGQQGRSPKLPKTAEELAKKQAKKAQKQLEAGKKKNKP